MREEGRGQPWQEVQEVSSCSSHLSSQIERIEEFLRLNVESCSVEFLFSGLPDLL